jgi:glucose-1-phosphate thymidylyltransferase
MKEKLKIIIPVAGEGTRMRPHTYTVPKPLIPVAGKEVLAHVLEPLFALDPEEVYFVIGHLGDRIEEFVKSTYKIKACFVEQKELLGLGFAIHLALQKIDSGPVLIILGDTIARTDFSEFVKSEGNVIGVKAVKDPRRFGVAVVDNGKIIAVEEKPQTPKSDLALIGLYYFQKIDALKAQLARLIAMGKKSSGEIQLTDALQFMLNSGELFHPFIVDGWHDCGKKDAFLETNRVLLAESAFVRDCPGSIIIPPVSIAPSAVVEESIIGPNVSISEEARINRSIIRDSIICKRASIDFSMLESSIIGERAVVKGKFNHLNVGNSVEIS